MHVLILSFLVALKTDLNKTLKTNKVLVIELIITQLILMSQYPLQYYPYWFPELFSFFNKSL